MREIAWFDVVVMRGGTVRIFQSCGVYFIVVVVVEVGTHDWDLRQRASYTLVVIWLV
jgi:hypothetical protein